MRWPFRLILLALLPVPALAAPSLCGHLPTAGRVAQPGPDEVVPAGRSPDRRLLCPPGFTLDMVARPPACRRPGQREVAGDPRAACRASVPLGPVADLPPQWRPTRSCPTNPVRAILPLEGLNAGVAEVALTSLATGVTATTLDEDSKGLDPAARPSAQGCFAHGCRLVQLDVAPDAPDTARLALAIEGGARVEIAVPLKTHCPQAAPSL